MSYSLFLRVEKLAIDANGHVNNVQYLHWMQDAAVAHANDSGCTAITKDLGASWVVRNHFVEYLRPAFLGDELDVQTWVTTLSKVSTIRKYRFYRRSDQILLAEGETLWVFVDADTGKPRSIPAEVAACFLPKETL